MLLQQGTPLKQLVDKFRATRFEPAGVTGNGEIRLATSALDYVMRWMELRYLKGKP
jgi:ribonucleoside-diphosphate reductase alpha chain